MLAEAVVQVLGNTSMFPLADPQHFRLQTPPFGNVGDDAGQGVDFPVQIVKRELGDDTGVRSVTLQGNFVELHGDARREHLQVIGAIGRGELGRKNLGIRLADGLFHAQMESLPESPVAEQVMALDVFEKDEGGAVVQNRA